MLARLLEYPSASTFDITALVRSPEKAKKLELFGVKAVVGSFKDSTLVEGLAENAHVIFSCVSMAAATEHCDWSHETDLGLYNLRMRR